MRKKFFALFMVCMMLLSGCGNEKSVNSNSEVKESNISENTEKETITEVEETAEENIPEEDISTKITKDESKLNLKEYRDSFEDRDIATEDNIVFWTDDFKPDETSFYLADSIDLYNRNGVYMGYTKPELMITPIGRFGDWYEISVSGGTQYAKVADIESAGMTGNDYLKSKEENETQNISNIQQNDSSGSVQPEAPKEAPPAETAVEQTPATSNKYTPEEAVAVYRSIMESNGITWDPNIKEFASWGSGYLPLEKGMTEQAAQSDVTSSLRGRGDGTSWMTYYVEITGSDENDVYVTCYVSAKYSCGFSNPLVPSIIVGERYSDYFTTIMEDKLCQLLAKPVFRWRNRSGLLMNAVKAA